MWWRPRYIVLKCTMEEKEKSIILHAIRGFIRFVTRIPILGLHPVWHTLICIMISWFLRLHILFLPYCDIWYYIVNKRFWAYLYHLHKAKLKNIVVNETTIEFSVILQGLKYWQHCFLKHPHHNTIRWLWLLNPNIAQLVKSSSSSSNLKTFAFGLY